VIRALRLKPLYGALVGAGRDPVLREALQFCLVSLGAETASALAIGLLSADAGVRMLACQTIGALALPDLAPRLEKLLADREEEVRAAAVEAVARVSREAAIPPLLRLLDDASEIVRDAIVMALKHLDAEAVSSALVVAPAASAPGRALILEIMRSNPHPAQLPALKRALGDASPALRRAAVAALSRQSIPDLIDELKPLLADPVADVRRETIVALGQARSIRVRELLLRQIAADPETRTHAIRTLGELGDCAAAPLLAEMLETERPLARIAILSALAELRDPVAEPLLVRALADEEPEVRRCAVDALARVATQTAIRHGLSAARDPEWQVRAAAIELLAASDDPASIAALERLCFDTNGFVASAARRRLEEKSPL
jgi:HEAT repeat protein